MSGRYKEILGPGIDPTIVYKRDNHARTTAYNISGATARFKYPEKMSDSLDVTMRYLVIQVFHKAGDHVNINLNIKNTSNIMMKFMFSTDERKNELKSPRQSVHIPLEKIPGDEWVNICFDLEYIMAKYWAGSQFECLQSIEIVPPCLIGWIFAIPLAIKPSNQGRDVPKKFRFIGNIEQKTVLFAEKPRKSRIPQLSQSSHKKSSVSPVEKGRAGTAATPTTTKQPRMAPATFEDDFLDDSEEDSDDGDAFMGGPPSVNRDDLNVQSGLPNNEEEELELVYIEALKCYYCPNNQQYYQIEEE